MEKKGILHDPTFRWAFKEASFLVLGVCLAVVGLFGGLPAQAAEVYTQSANDSSNTALTDGNNVSLNAGAIEDAGFAATGYVDTFDNATDVITSVSWLMKNTGGGACTGTLDTAGDIYYCTGDTNCTSGARVFDTFDTCDALNVPAGGEQWVECTLSTPTGTPQLNRTWFIGGPTYDSTSGCTSTSSRYQNSDVSPGSSNYNSGAASNTDAALRICSSSTDCGASLAPPDPRDPPTTVVVKPEAATYDETDLPFRFASSVCSADYTGEDPAFEWEIDVDTSGWTSYASGTFDYSGLYGLLVTSAYTGTTCDSGSLTYGIGAIPDSVFTGPFTAGDYRIRVRSTFGSFTTGDWSDWTNFTTAEGGASGGGSGGGGGGSWGGSDTVVPTVPTPSCKVFSTNGPPDGWSCLWTWVKYSIAVPAGSSIGGFFTNETTGVFAYIRTRWPIAYLFDVLDAAYDGLTDATPDCPIPSLGETTVAGIGSDPDVTMPGFDLCPILEDTTALLDADAGIQTWGSRMVYMAGLAGVVAIGWVSFF